ncbi:MAG: cbb3-type cytochrome c oxidase subunit 3 [Alphaproteobacteria bacterium]
MTYEGVREFAGTWGLVYMVVLFVVVVGWALWPANRRRFQEAARIPLDDEPRPAGAEQRGKER